MAAECLLWGRMDNGTADSCAAAERRPTVSTHTQVVAAVMVLLLVLLLQTGQAL